jgi:hypothetical protein
MPCSFKPLLLGGREYSKIRSTVEVAVKEAKEENFCLNYVLEFDFWTENTVYCQISSRTLKYPVHWKY